MDRKTINSKNFRCLGLSILEALVATVIVGIGFVAVFQMVNYSAVSINTSAERTKTNFLIAMIAEDLVAERKFIKGTGETLHATDSLVDKKNVLNITSCEKYEGDGIMYPDAGFNTSPDRKIEKWKHLLGPNSSSYNRWYYNFQP